MFGPRLKISRSLQEKLARVAASRGYASAEEFALHVLEQAVADAEDSLSEEEVKKRLKGLGYLG
jgi:hypothetical protein